MKKNVFTLLALSFFGAYLLPLMAQDDVQKVKVQVEIIKDGETETIVKEYDVSDHSSMHWEFDNEANDGSEVIISKVIGSDDELAWMKSSELSETKNTAFLGVVGYTINENGGGYKRVRITKVIQGEAAAKAGVENEDIIESIDGVPLETYEELVELVREKKPGDILDVKVNREGKTIKMKVTLGERKLNERFFTQGLEDANNTRVRVERAIAISKDDYDLIQKAIGVNPSDGNSFKKVTMELYPNPSDNNFRYKLKIDEGGELERILLDTQGRVMETKTLKNKNGIYDGEINLMDKPAGNYLLIFKRGEKIVSEKLVKK